MSLDAVTRSRITHFCIFRVIESQLPLPGSKGRARLVKTPPPNPLPS